MCITDFDDVCKYFIIKENVHTKHTPGVTTDVLC